MKKQRKVDPKIYTTDFYLNKCLGSDEFIKSNGLKLHWRVKEMLSNIKFKKNDSVLDLGCGRGDISIFIAEKTNKVIGIDYSSDAIKIASEIRKKLNKNLQKKIEFLKMDATNLKFQQNSFDKVIAIDIFEHLYTEELESTMSEIKRVLKPNGILFIHVGTNKYLYDITYKFYIRPVNFFISKLDRIIRNKKYPPLPKNPRTKEELEQHVNEPTYFYIKNLLRKHKFTGKIIGEVGYLKEKKSTLSRIYNFFQTFYPLSKINPLNILFAWVFVVKAKNIK